MRFPWGNVRALGMTKLKYKSAGRVAYNVSPSDLRPGVGQQIAKMKLVELPPPPPASIYSLSLRNRNAVW